MKRTQQRPGTIAWLFGLALVLLGMLPAQAQMVIDNSSAQFSTVGAWTSSTVVAGFEDTDYVYVNPNGNPTRTATWTPNVSLKGSGSN